MIPPAHGVAGWSERERERGRAALRAMLGDSAARVRAGWALALDSGSRGDTAEARPQDDGLSSVLNGLQPSQMMETTDRTGKTTTFAQVLLHVSHHNATHLGQLLWITKMLQPGTIKDLGRTMRQR